jgi:hypothetical protein
MSDFLEGWHRQPRLHKTTCPVWRHPWTDLRIVQTGQGFTGYEIHKDKKVLVQDIENFLMARLIVKKIVRTGKVA